jgi:hypothetical protein
MLIERNQSRSRQTQNNKRGDVLILLFPDLELPDHYVLCECRELNERCTLAVALDFSHGTFYLHMGQVAHEGRHMYIGYGCLTP